MASLDKVAVPSNKRHADRAAEARPKRSKTAVACNVCRDRKRKCDGKRPVCGACSVKTKGEQNCIWDSDKADKFHDSEYVMSLQNRVRQLESMLLTPPTTSLTSTRTEDQSMPFDVPAQEHLVRPLSTWEPSPPIIVGASSDSRPSNAHNQTSSVSLDAISGSTMSIQPATYPVRIPAQVRGTPRHQSSPVNGAQPTKDLDCFNTTELDRDLDEADESEADGDGMGAIASTSTHEKTGSFALERAYFGPSSTLGFMKSIQAVLQPDSASRGISTARNKGIREQGFKNAKAISFGHRNYVIPTREIADALLSSYWKYFHPIYPYLFKSAFNIRYQRLWSPPHETAPYTSFYGSMNVSDGRQITEDYYCNEPIYFCILNLVFALGTQYSPMVDPGECCETGEVFFQRAKDFIDLDSLGCGEVTLVQALLLMGHYLQSTDRSSMCWNIVGLAIRTAQSIGLDKPARRHHHADERMSKLDEEIRRRLWGGCILQDRVASMMFGRQLMLSPASVRDAIFPEGIEEEDLMDVAATPDRRLSTSPKPIVFFAHAVKLCQLVGEVLDAVYTDSKTDVGIIPTSAGWEKAPSLIDKVKTGNLHDILKLDADLTKWRDNLPSFLQLSTYKAASANSLAQESTPILAETPPEFLTTFTRQAKILQARFLHIKILLSRPVLAVLVSNSDASTGPYCSTDALQTVLNQTMLEKISKHCIQAAQDLTFLVYDSLISKDAALPAWWYNVFYLYTTATIFVAQRLCPRLMPGGDDDRWQQCWDKCLRGLHRYESQSVSARRCFKVLDLIDKQFFRAKDRAQTFSPGLDATANDGVYQQPDVHRGNTNDDYADSGFSFEPNLQFPSAGGLSWNLALDTAEMEWLANIPFDSNIDIDSSTIG